MVNPIQSILEGPESSSPFEPIDAGTYRLHIEDARVEEEGVSQSGGRIPPRVRVGFSTETPEGRAARLWHNFFIDEQRPQGFLRKFYRLATGQVLSDAVSGDATEQSIAEAIATTVVGGNVTAAIGVRKDKKTEDMVNYIARWVDDE